MTHLESLTEKLHALLPELLELSFGCKITTNKWNSNYSIETITGTYHGEFVEFDCLFRNGRIKAHDIAEVLGHEPQLHHILLAMQRSKCDIPLIDYNGNFWDCDDDCVRFWDTEHHYDLALPLHKQSPETILFLDSLLPNTPSQND